MDKTLKEMRLHTLRGDIQTCGMDGMSRRGIKDLLHDRYVNLDSDILSDEFDSILDEEYKKVEAWRKRQK
jgi:hypothetical protein